MEPRHDRHPHRDRAVGVRRALLAAATAFVAINLWTGAPLLALWVGSMVVGTRALSMGAVFVVVAVLATLTYAMAHALVWLNETYNRLTGRREGERRLRWLRSMNSQGPRPEEERQAGTLLEQIVMSSVYLAVITFLVWFFGFAGSPMPSP
jgi:ABC-type multidrug transport system fused ATPase/permease subunit